MNQVNYDPELFDVDGYGNLYPKSASQLAVDSIAAVEQRLTDLCKNLNPDEPIFACDFCPDYGYCWN